MEWIDLLASTTERFAEVLETGDLDARVPTCPDWTLADLGEHTRGVHAWATHAIIAGNPKGGTPPPGPGRDALVAGYRTAAGGLLDALRRTPPEEPVWTFGPDSTSSFWRRRQVHEVAMHLYDALASQGREEDWAISPELGWDGVEEVVTVFYPRQIRLGRRGPITAPLRVSATDLPGREVVLEPDAPGPLVALTAPAVDLLFMLWGRRPATGPAGEVLASAAVTP